jgi:ATP-dependent DNA ligase
MLSPSASPAITARLDLRQAGLFEFPPTWIAPAIPTLVSTAPSGLNWLHEIKHDGYGTICVVDQGAVSIYTRRRLNWVDRMPSIARALEGLKVRSTVIDGEAIEGDGPQVWRHACNMGLEASSRSGAARATSPVGRMRGAGRSERRRITSR